MNSPSRSPRTLVGMTALALAAALVLSLVVVALARGSGNTHALESGYGSSMGSSVNGTGALAALLRNQGHEVRTAWRLTAELGGLGRRDRPLCLRAGPSRSGGSP